MFKARGRGLNVRCLFFENEAPAFAPLQKFCDSVTDIEATPIYDDFTDRTATILKFVRERPNCFPFLFIDPTGWSPLVLRKISPLLQMKPAEVLVNFMTSHIRRFLEVEGKGFDVRFGSEYMKNIAGLSGQDLGDAAVFSFANELRKEGQFDFVSTAVVLHPQYDKEHFHLIYATRHPLRT